MVRPKTTGPAKMEPMMIAAYIAPERVLVKNVFKIPRVLK